MNNVKDNEVLMSIFGDKLRQARLERDAIADVV